MVQDESFSPSYLWSMTFGACSMQQNQTSLVLLHVAGNEIHRIYNKIYFAMGDARTFSMRFVKKHVFAAIAQKNSPVSHKLYDAK